MARPYSNDLRERVAGSVASGRSCRETARLFGVSVASVVKWSQRHRATGSAASRPMGGKKRPVLEAERAWLLARLEALLPHAVVVHTHSVRTLAAELADKGKPVSHNTVWVLLRRAGHSFKKNAVRHGAGPTGGRTSAGTVAQVSGPA